MEAGEEDITKALAKLSINVLHLTLSRNDEFLWLCVVTTLNYATTDFCTQLCPYAYKGWGYQNQQWFVHSPPSNSFFFIIGQDTETQRSSLEEKSVHYTGQILNDVDMLTRKYQGPTFWVLISSPLLQAMHANEFGTKF